MPTPESTDVLIVGGGAIGLSIAYQLAGDGVTVRLVERGEVGRQASWAGAGILPPGSWFSSDPAMDAPAAVSRTLHARWSDQLREETGIDDEYDECGAFYATNLGLTAERASHLKERLDAWEQIGISAERVDGRPTAGSAAAEGFFVAAEAQVRNPRRVRALAAACEHRGVRIDRNADVEDFRVVGDRIESVLTTAGDFAAGSVCLAAGAWTGQLCGRVGFEAPIRPVRGQMVLLRAASRPFRHILHAGGSYLVPRRDGRVLVGATVEDVGFDTTTEARDTEALVAFARAAAPCLAGATVEAAWAGLRPASGDGLPIIGPLPGFANGWIATGHYRSGLQFSPATAVVMSELLRGEPPSFDIAAFDAGRFLALPAVS